MGFFQLDIRYLITDKRKGFSAKYALVIFIIVSATTVKIIEPNVSDHIVQVKTFILTNPT